MTMYTCEDVVTAARHSGVVESVGCYAGEVADSQKSSTVNGPNPSKSQQLIQGTLLVHIRMGDFDRERPIKLEGFLKICLTNLSMVPYPE